MGIKWKKTAVIYFKVAVQLLYGETEQYRENLKYATFGTRCRSAEQLKQTFGRFTKQ
jgi:hypothetical protein